MIEMGHIGVGALAGRECSGPITALIAGVASHALMDVAPHGEINDQGFEVVSTAVGLGILAARFGPLSPILWGAIGGVLPDAEHVLPASIKPSSPVFPTHFIDILHASDTELSIPAWAQVMLGGAVVGMLVAARRRKRLATTS
jgi:hypothetical protein